MRLFEMARLPKRAGLAELRFLDRGARTPATVREDRVITLPNDRQQVEFFPLKSGEQFLVAVSHQGNKEYGALRVYRQIYFGGTDEQPFLVELAAPAFAAFCGGGEMAFYDALKPTLIKEFEQKFPEGEARRQGDIWAFRMPFRWGRFIEMPLCRNTVLHYFPFETKAPVFGTRHLFTGNFFIVDRHLESLTIADGVLEAPDHAPLDISGRPHVLAQTSHLVRPQEAD